MSKTNMPLYAILFKTHFWDDFVERQFIALQATCPSGHLWVAVDETLGPVDGIKHDKIFRTRDCDMHELGLPKQNGVSLNWYNVDYPLLAFFQAHADYDFYIMVEFDAVARVNIDVLASDAYRRGVDFVAHPISTPIEQWQWTHTLEGVWEKDEIESRLLCLSGFSRRAVARLLALRLDHAIRYERGEFPRWPFSEGFVPTAIKTAKFVAEELEYYGSTENYDWWPPAHETELPNIVMPAFVHPVLTGIRYVNSLLRYSSAETYINSPSSKLRQQLARESSSIVVPALVNVFKMTKNSAALIALWQATKDAGDQSCSFSLAPILATFASQEATCNLALHKFAYQSSVCSSSRNSEPALDATHAINGKITGDYGFHTDQELQPWWMVDLGEPCVISEMRIYNRVVAGFDWVAARANYLSVWSSCSGRHWELVYRHIASTPFGGVDGNPLVISCTSKMVARFVRIECEGLAILHLDEVEVFGSKLVPQSGRHEAYGPLDQTSGG